MRPLNAEIEYQSARARKIAVTPTSRDTIRRYSENRHWRLYRTEFLYKSLGDLKGKSLLDFGCGEGIDSVIYAALGAKVTGVDISAELIAAARQRAKLDGVEVEFVAGDILQLNLPAYDVVVAGAVLHHVDLRVVLPRLLKCVKPGGLVAITEPAEPCGFMRLIRRLLPVPAEGSPDEHPLTPEELQFVKELLRDCTWRYYDVLGRLSRYVQGQPLRWLLAIDRAILAVLPRCGATIVLTGRPRAGT
jgi:SAM-dependent methyltransferase